MSNNTTTNKISNHFYFTAVASTCASVISKFLIYPIETIKNKVQVNRMTKVYQKGLILKLIKKTYQQENIKGFFRGAGLACLGSAPACCCYMTTYQLSKYYLNNIEIVKKHSALVYLTSGFIAQLVSCVFWLPLDVIKQRMQTQSELKLYQYKNSFDAFKTIRLDEGNKGLYRSYGGTLLYFGPFSALYFYLYENLKLKFNKKDEKATFAKSALMAGSSGIIAGILCNPIDLAKIRNQVDKKNIGSTPLFGYKNVFDGIYKIYKYEGFFSLYKGCLVRIWTTGPITASIMGFTELIRTKLKIYYKSE